MKGSEATGHKLELMCTEAKEVELVVVVYLSVEP